MSFLFILQFIFFTEEHLVWFQTLAIENKTVINVSVQIFVWTHVFNSFWLSVIDGLNGKSMFSFCKKLPNCIPKYLKLFVVPPAIKRVPVASQFLVIIFSEYINGC